MNDDVTRKPSLDAAESQTPSMCGNSMRENRWGPYGKPGSLPCRMAAGDGRERRLAIRPTWTWPGSRTIP